MENNNPIKAEKCKKRLFLCFKESEYMAEKNETKSTDSEKDMTNEGNQSSN